MAIAMTFMNSNELKLPPSHKVWVIKNPAFTQGFNQISVNYLNQLINPDETGLLK